MSDVQRISPNNRPPGRPRNEKIHAKALSVTIETYAELGWNGFNFDVVAARARIGRPALYRRWTDRESLLTEAFLASSEPMIVIDTGSLREDLIRLVSIYANQMRGARGRAGARLLIERESLPRVYETVNSEVSLRRYDLLDGALERARSRGEIAAPMSPWPIRALVLGSVFVWQFGEGIKAPPTDNEIDALVDLILFGIVSSCPSKGKTIQP